MNTRENLVYGLLRARRHESTILKCSKVLEELFCTFIQVLMNNPDPTAYMRSVTI